MWKERLWQVFLVIILGFVLTMCNRSGSNNKSLNADSTSTVTVESLPTITLANAVPSAISQKMFCNGDSDYSNGVITYEECDASDDTVLSSGTITHDAALAAGWKLVGSGCSAVSTGSSQRCSLFHK